MKAASSPSGFHSERKYETTGEFMLDIKELKSNIRTITECENILTYLDVISSNPSLSYLNHLLLFAQGKRAEVVCGRGAWEAMGRKIKENAQMLHIIYPAIVITEGGVPYKELDKDVIDIETGIQFMIKQTQFDIRYLVMGAYAYSDTDGKEIEKATHSINFMDRIAVITQSTMEIVDKAFPLGQMGEYDTETDIFYISKKCPDEKRNEVLVSIFIDYLMYDNKNNDKQLKLAVKYVVLKYFGYDISNINPKIFGLLRKRGNEELIIFCRELQYFSWKAINELQEIPTLNFDETAFVNELVCSDRKDDLYCLFDNVIASIDYADPYGLNDDIKEELVDLRHKISLLDNENIQEMYIQKQRSKIFTYPATPIRYDLTNYLK